MRVCIFNIVSEEDSGDRLWELADWSQAKTGT